MSVRGVRLLRSHHRHPGRGDGYASSVGGSEAGISAIALPIQGAGPVLGSLNLIFFWSSMTPEVAAKRYLPDMKQAVKDIERRWSAVNKARVA